MPLPLLLAPLESVRGERIEVGEEVEAEMEATLLRFARGLGCGLFWTGLLSSESDMSGCCWGLELLGVACCSYESNE